MSTPSGRRPGGRGGRGPAKPAPTARRTTRVEPVGQDAPVRTTSAFTSRALVLLLVVAVLGVSYASSVRAWLNQRNEQSSLSSQIADTRRAIAQLRTDKARWNDPAYIEAQARLRFGWVMPGERSYRVIGKDGKVLSAGHGDLSTPGTEPPAAPPWWQGTVDSLVQAGTPPPARKKNAEPVHHPAARIGLPGRSGR